MNTTGVNGGRSTAETIAAWLAGKTAGMTNEQIAAELGIARRSLCRALQRARRRGLLP